MKVVFCGIVRDCAASLSRNLNRIECVRGNFEKLHFVLVENDSKDETKEVLKDLEERHADSIIEMSDQKSITLPKRLSSGVNPSYSEYRISKMAAYRNRYLELIENRIGFANVDWVVMLDWDVEGFDIDGLLDTLSNDEAWDVATANGRMKTGFFGSVYYDCYAYRELEADGPCTEASIRSVRNKVPEMNPGSPVIPVASAFNALAVYRPDGLEGLRYRVAKNDDPRVEVWCEHVTFHRDLALRGYGRVVIDPRLRVAYNTRIQAMAQIPRRVFRWLKSW